MAYWPGSGNSLDDIDYTSCWVRLIQFFSNILYHLITQRITYCCASGEIKTTIGSVSDTVLFAHPISMKFCI